MKIIEKKIIADFNQTRIVKYVVESAIIAQKALPGQYVVVMVTANGERVPLTIVDSDKNKGTITLIVQELGFSTKSMGRLNPGDSLFALLGPLGHPTEIKNFGKVLIIGGGVGIAELYPMVKALNQAGNTICSILGGRNKDLVILSGEISEFSKNTFIASDDGSIGQKGLVTDVLTQLLEKDQDWQIAYCVGPIPMMKAVSQITKQYNIKTIVSLNAIMLDATGMCGCCRLYVNNEVKFCCVDGPDFDAHQVDFEDLIRRQKRFSEQENQALKCLIDQCKISQQLKP